MRDLVMIVATDLPWRGGNAAASCGSTDSPRPGASFVTGLADKCRTGFWCI